MGQEVRYLGGDHLLRIARSKTRLHHCGRIDVDLESWLVSSKNISLKIRRDVDHEGVFSLVHEGNDIPLGNQLRQLEKRRIERMGDPARELGIVLVDDSDRSVM